MQSSLISYCYQNNTGKPHFKVFVEELKKVCPNIIAEGIENIHYNKLSKEAGLWGGQGYFFPSVPLSEIKQINSAWL